ncbi:MAG TPA: hypothetical protein VGA29_05930, partial [Ignavibacteriaceae bacterium]
MVNAQHHRGPDAQNHFSHTLFPDDTRVFIGASRLRISENSSESDQPFFSRNKDAAILFNGEIYNFFDLKNELLKLGLRFTTNSDTEVLLHWIREFGTDRLHELEGMFAFVYCNFNNGEIVAARDRFGMKPLHYFEDDHTIIFSSEARGIIASGLVKKELNERQLPNYFNYKHAIPPETFYKDVFQLNTGHYLHIKNGLMSGPTPFYQANFEKHSFDVGDFRQEILDSLYQQLY